MRPELFEVRPVVLLRFLRARALNVEDDLRTTIDRFDIDRPGGLDQNLEAVVAQAADQIEPFLLGQRFAAGDLDEIAAVAPNAGDDLIDRHPLPAGEGVLGVAPAAAQIAASQTDEDAGAAGVARFALNRMKDLGNADHRP